MIINHVLRAVVLSEFLFMVISVMAILRIFKLFPCCLTFTTTVLLLCLSNTALVVIAIDKWSVPTDPVFLLVACVVTMCDLVMVRVRHSISRFILRCPL